MSGFEHLVVQEYRRLRLVGLAKDAQAIVEHYKSQGWQHVLTGPNVRPDRTVDARYNVFIFEKENIRPGTVVAEGETNATSK